MTNEPKRPSVRLRTGETITVGDRVELRVLRDRRRALEIWLRATVTAVTPSLVFVRYENGVERSYYVGRFDVPDAHIRLLNAVDRLSELAAPERPEGDDARGAA